MVLAALVLGACSGDSSADSTTAPTAPAAPTTVAATTPVSSTAPGTVLPLPTTTAAPTTAPTSVAPSTAAATLPADPALSQQAVIDATVASWQAFRAVARDPQDADKLTELGRTTSGASLDQAIQTLAEFSTTGLVAVENPDVPASIDVYEETVVVDPVAGTASAEYCRIGSDLGIQPGGNPDGTDKVVINEVNAYHEKVLLVFANGRWTDDDGELIQEFPGATTCAA